MITHQGLHDIQIGVASPSEARRTLRAYLTDKDRASVEHVYAALRGWTWKALHHRRFDSDLQAWFDILQSAQGHLQRSDPEVAQRLTVLSDLVFDSIRYGQANADELLLRRSHLGEILSIVRRHNGRAERRTLEQETGLGTTHLSQLLTTLVAGGKLERIADGRAAHFELTDQGRAFLEKWDQMRAETQARDLAASGEAAAKPPRVPKRAMYLGRKFALTPPERESATTASGGVPLPSVDDKLRVHIKEVRFSSDGAIVSHGKAHKRLPPVMTSIEICPTPKGDTPEPAARMLNTMISTAFTDEPGFKEDRVYAE